MSRLDIIRSYFADQFFTTLVNDPRLAALQYPAELFNGPGNFIVPSTVAGLTQMPTIANLDERITTATGAERTELETFRAIELDALAAIVPGLANLTSSWGNVIAATYAPVVHHPDGQDFFPAAMHDYLNYADGTLTARYYSATGQRALTGQVFNLLFDNPEVINATGLPTAPYQPRIPFAATIGCAPPQAGYPAGALDAGRLDLGPSFGRLGPGRLPPTLYAEIKGIQGALALNQAYQAAALTGGQYAPLRNNRIHADPLLAAAASGSAPAATTVVVPEELIMIVYHGFYPADDDAHRNPRIGATNREFHHLGFGILLPGTGDPQAAGPATGAAIRGSVQAPPPDRPGYLFTCVGPDTVRMFPLGHPALQMTDDQGNISQDGTHANIYFANMSPAGWQANFKYLVSESWPEIVTFDGAALAVGALIGGLPGLGVGAIVAAVVTILWLLICLFCALLGLCGDGDGGDDGEGSGDNDYTQSANCLAPQGVPVSGLSGPTRSFVLNLIPHFPDRNLYGINAGGATTFTIVNDAGLDETLAWLGFPAGFGYQFDHTVPGPTDIAGTSVRNYFDMFTRKFLDVEAARGQVTYFA